MKTPSHQLGQLLLPLIGEAPLPPNLHPRYNIAPTQEVLSIVATPEGPHPTLLRWGLIPSWATDWQIGNRMINARRETLREKPAFKGPLQGRRCLIVADGYYEWQSRTGASKQPFWITPVRTPLLLLAGLWERNAKLSDPPIETCTIITTEANAALRDIHDRMPMALDLDVAGQWLNPDLGADQAWSMLEPIADDFLQSQAVSTLVNNPKNDGPACIAPRSP